MYPTRSRLYPIAIVEKFSGVSHELWVTLRPMKGVRTRQLAFRLPLPLIEDIEGCEAQIRATGLNLSRTDVVRLLLTYALERSGGQVTELLGLPRKRGSKRET